MEKVAKSRTPYNWFDILNYILLTVFALCTLYPFIYVIVGSFNDGVDFSFGGVWIFPREFSLTNYYVVVNDTRFWGAYIMTILRTVVGTFVSVVFTSLVSYAMASKKLICKKAFYYINIFTMFFSGGLIPYFLVIVNMGLYNTFFVYIIPAMYSVYNMIIFSNFFANIPYELYEAAIMDGAGELRIWWNVYLPLSKAILATVALWVSVGHWNGYLSTMLYTNDDSLRTLQYYLMMVIKNTSLPADEIGVPIDILNKISAQTVSYAAIVLSVVPIICLYPLIQRNFGKGATVGAVKE